MLRCPDVKYGETSQKAQKEWRKAAIKRLKTIQKEELKSDSRRNSVESADDYSVVDDKSSINQNESSTFLNGE